MKDCKLVNSEICFQVDYVLELLKTCRAEYAKNEERPLVALLIALHIQFAPSERTVHKGYCAHDMTV